MKGCWVRTKETNRKKHTVPGFWRNIHLCGFSNDAFIVYFDIEEVVFNGE